MVALVGCGAPPTANPPTARPSEPSASAEGSAAPKVPPPTVRTRTAPAIPRNDLAARIHVLTTGWRPAVQTAVVAVTEGQTSTLVAVPVAGGGPAVPLVELTNAYSWNLRQDGGALAASVRNGSDSSRIVVWDVLSDSARWLTDDQSGVFDDGPVWTPDGSAVYYGEHSATATTYTDRGIFRINLDGGLPVLVHGPDGNGGSPVRLTPDGRWLIWTRSQAGGSTDVLDLTTGENKSFDITGTSGEIAWRAARPRALVMSGGCCAGRPGGQLILWDDISGESQEIIGSKAAPLVFTGTADWDPTGTLIAAAGFERNHGPAFRPRWTGFHRPLRLHRDAEIEGCGQRRLLRCRLAGRRHSGQTLDARGLHGVRRDLHDRNGSASALSDNGADRRPGRDRRAVTYPDDRADVRRKTEC